jgi:acyl-CoA thioester hydrolase
MSAYSTTMRLRIDWSEVDSFGHVNNLAILRYAQTARLHYLEEIGMMRYHSETGIGPVLASTSCQFKKQLFYPGSVSVHTVVDHVKNTSFHMRHSVLNEAREAVAEMHDVLVMFDYGKAVKQAIPEAFRRRMETAGDAAGPDPA